MKTKKVVFIISFMILLLIFVYFIAMYSNIKITPIINDNTQQSQEIETKMGDFDGLKCIQEDENGVCEVYMNTWTNSTYEVQVE